MCALHASVRLQCHFKLSSPSCGTRIPFEYSPVAFLSFSIDYVSIFLCSNPHRARSFLRHDPRQMKCNFYGVCEVRETRAMMRGWIRKENFPQNRLKCILWLYGVEIWLCSLRSSVSLPPTLAQSTECIGTPIFSIFCSLTIFLSALILFSTTNSVDNDTKRKSKMWRGSIGICMETHPQCIGDFDFIMFA